MTFLSVYPLAQLSFCTMISDNTVMNNDFDDALESQSVVVGIRYVS